MFTSANVAHRVLFIQLLLIFQAFAAGAETKPDLIALMELALSLGWAPGAQGPSTELCRVANARFVLRESGRPNLSCLVCACPQAGP